MKNKYNTLYYFVIDSEGNVLNKIDVETIPRWLIEKQLKNNEVEDLTRNESGVCDKDHPLPCGLDKICEL